MHLGKDSDRKKRRENRQRKRNQENWLNQLIRQASKTKMRKWRALQMERRLVDVKSPSLVSPRVLNETPTPSTLASQAKFREMRVWLLSYTWQLCVRFLKKGWVVWQLRARVGRTRGRGEWICAGCKWICVFVAVRRDEREGCHEGCWEGNHKVHHLELYIA